LKESNIKVVLLEPAVLRTDMVLEASDDVTAVHKANWPHYERSKNAFTKFFNATHGASSQQDPKLVNKIVEAALNDPEPNILYQCGANPPPFVTLLPRSVIDFIWVKIFGV
jgi:hypothetical protein